VVLLHELLLLWLFLFDFVTGLLVSLKLLPEDDLSSTITAFGYGKSGLEILELWAYSRTRKYTHLRGSRFYHPAVHMKPSSLQYDLDVPQRLTSEHEYAEQALCVPRIFPNVNPKNLLLHRFLPTQESRIQ
jgi:hypothetical protein